MDNVENEVKSLIKTATWNTMANKADYVGMKLPHGDFVDELMDAIADEVYELIWEYIKDYD
jgi:hypothetical protein